MRIKFAATKVLLLGVTAFTFLLAFAVFGLAQRGSAHEEEELFSVLCKHDGIEQRIQGFYNGETLLFCLPNYMRGQELRLDMEGDRRLVIGDAVWTKGAALEGLEAGIEYEALFGDGGAGDRALRVCVEYGSELPVMYLSTASGNMDYIHEQKGNAENGYMRVTDAQGRTQGVERVQSISGRGNTAWDAPKKSYTLRLDDARDILGMGEGKTWVLNANYYDGTYLRNQIGFELAAAGGISYVPEAHFVELYVNEQYMGLYQIAEKIQAGTGRANIGDNYLLEIDYRERAAGEEAVVMLSNDQPIVIHSPKQGCNVEGVQAFFDSFSARMEQAGERLPRENIDFASFVRLAVMEDILQDMDFGYSSQYLYLDLENEILYGGTVWDMDNTMGRGTVQEVKPFFVTSYELQYNNLSRWYARMYEDEEFYRMAAKEYRENFRPLLTDLIQGGIKERAQSIRSSVAMDEMRFPGAHSVFMGEAPMEEDVDYLIEYLEKKLEIMDECFDVKTGHRPEPVQFPALERQPSAFEEAEQETRMMQADEELKGVLHIPLYTNLRMFSLLLIMVFGSIIIWKKTDCRKGYIKHRRRVK